jgi:hypothetical protein
VKPGCNLVNPAYADKQAYQPRQGDNASHDERDQGRFPKAFGNVSLICNDGGEDGSDQDQVKADRQHEREEEELPVLQVQDEFHKPNVSKKIIILSKLHPNAMLSLKIMGATAVVLTLSSAAVAQPLLMPFDSVSLKIQDATTAALWVGAWNLKTVGIYSPPAQPAQPLPRRERKAGDYVLTLFTGLSTSTTSKDTTLWVTENQIQCFPQEFTWRIPTFFLGVRTTERQKNNGQVDVTDRVVGDWTKEADGFIISKQDTLGAFTMNTSPNAEQTAILTKLAEQSQWVVKRFEQMDRPAVKAFSNQFVDDWC